MKTLRIISVVCLLLACLGPFVKQSSADATELTFGIDEGGQGIPIGKSLYGTVTLNLESNGTILVQGTTAGTPYSFYDQAQGPGYSNGEGGIFGFGSSAPGLSVSGCSANGASTTNCALNPLTGTTLYDGYGTFQDSVDILAGNSVFNIASTPVLQGYAFTQFSFTLSTTAVGGFTSVNQLLTGTNATAVASHVCDTGSVPASNGCADVTSNGFPKATYVGLTPEPGSYLLFGTGLLGLGVLLRRKGAISLPH